MGGGGSVLVIAAAWFWGAREFAFDAPHSYDARKTRPDIPLTALRSPLAFDSNGIQAPTARRLLHQMRNPKREAKRIAKMSGAVMSRFTAIQ